MLQVTPSLRKLFETLADLDVAAQQATLGELRLSPVERTALAAMLAADRSAASFFDVCATDRIVQLSEDALEPAALVGATMGPFRLVEFLGQGGSSVVFRAARQIGQSSQDVALKVLHAGLFSAESRRRFRREQEILAQLSHPNIAQFIDAGVSQTGVPYIAIELVKGVDLLTFAAHEGLDGNRRLRLFAAACRAVDAAHKVSVVHRDLKPSNVLVTPDSVVKILDFGIAKLIDADETSTAPQNSAFTPAYAAPEQHQNHPITPSTDVYSLGVMLSELILGKRLGPDASQRPTDTESRRLDRDLLLLLSTALASEPKDRYPSAGHLADDIQSYLRCEPLAAHRPSVAYRALKFTHRHKRAMLSWALLCSGFLALLGFAMRELQIARLDEIRAHAETDRANSMRDFMFDFLTGAEPTSPGGPESVVDAADRVINAAAAAGQNANPTARIELLTRMAAVLDSQGKFERARELLVSVAAEAKERFGEDDALTLGARRAGAANAVQRGQVAEARSAIEDLLARSKSMRGDLPLQLLIDSSSLASKERNGSRALRESAHALELARRSSPGANLRYALSSRGIALLKFGDDGQAIEIYRELLKVSMTELGGQHVAVADAYLGLARAYRHQGYLQNAEDFAAQALAIDRAIFPTDHPRVAADLAEVASVASEQREFKRALDYRREVVRMTRAVYGDSHPNVAAALANLGESLNAVGDYDAAVRTFRESHHLFVGEFGESHWCAVTVQSNLGFSLGRSGELRGGIAELDQAITRIKALSEPSFGLLARAYEQRILLALDAQRGKDALDYIAQAQAALEHESVRYWDWDGRLDVLRARALIVLGRPADAQQYLSKARADLANSSHPDPAVVTSDLLLQAAVEKALGHVTEANQFRVTGLKAFAALKSPPREMQALVESLAATSESKSGAPANDLSTMVPSH